MASNPVATSPTLFVNRNEEVIGASVTLLVLPTIFVALRVLSRWMAGAGFWWDDYTVIIGMVLSWGPNIVNISASRQSLGHHTAVMLPNVLMSFFKHLYAFEILYSLAMASVKYSVILSQYRIFPIVQFRRLLLACGVFVAAFTTASTIVFILECTPISDFWITFGGHLAYKLGGRCINLDKFLLVNGSINTVTDFALLLFPLPLLWRLRASTLQKYILMIIFITGLSVTAVSMVRLVVISQYRGADLTWDFVSVNTWTAAEPSIAVVSACLPSLRPLFVRLVWGSAQRPKANAATSAYLHDDYGLASPAWRSGGKSHHDRSFNRLPDNASKQEIYGSSSKTNGVTVYGGKDGRGTEEETELDGLEEETPMGRIRAKTTVVWTVSERVDWQDDLF